MAASTSLRLATVAPGQAEIFLSVQGEGPSMGQPAIFVRTSQCNLHCHWCDTPYTWNFTGTDFTHRDDGDAPAKFDRAAESLTLDTDAAAEHVHDLACTRVIFTGGEPLLQQTALVDVIDRLNAMSPDYVFEVETNGTLAPTNALAARIDQFNVSPKLAHSGNAEALRVKPKSLMTFAAHSGAVLKFVLAEPGDVEEALAMADRFAFPRDRVYFMPEGTQSDTLRARMAWILEACIAHGVRFSDRLHIHAFGDTRGT